MTPRNQLTILAACGLALSVLAPLQAEAATIFGDLADFEREGDGDAEELSNPIIVAGKSSAGATTGGAGANAIFVFDIGSLNEDPVAAGTTLNLYLDSMSSGNDETADLYFVGFSDAVGNTPSTAGFLAAASDPNDTTVGVSDGVELIVDSFATPSTGTGAYLSADITAILNARPSGTAGDVVFFRVNPDDDSISGNEGFSFASADATGTANDPFINVVPEPASLALMGLGALCLLPRRRG